MINNLAHYWDRYVYVFQGLKTDAMSKAVYASALSMVYAVFDDILSLLTVESLLVTAVVLLLTIDLITGLWRSWLIRGARSLTSRGLRSTIAKVIEYCIILLAFIIISNMNPNLEWVRLWAFTFVSATEIFSIGENLFNSKVKNLVRAFLNKSDTGFDPHNDKIGRPGSNMGTDSQGRNDKYIQKEDLGDKP